MAARGGRKAFALPGSAMGPSAAGGPGATNPMTITALAPRPDHAVRDTNSRLGEAGALVDASDGQHAHVAGDLSVSRAGARRWDRPGRRGVPDRAERVGRHRDGDANLGSPRLPRRATAAQRRAQRPWPSNGSCRHRARSSPAQNTGEQDSVSAASRQAM